MSSTPRLAAGGEIRSEYCFVCGRNNPRGLNIPFNFANRKVTAVYTPEKEYCGFDNIVHGGILSTLADEAMMHLIWSSDLRAATAEIVMRFHSTAIIGQKILIEAEFLERSDKLIRCQCRLRDSEGRKIASAKGKFLPLTEKELADFKKSF